MYIVILSSAKDLNTARELVKRKIYMYYVYMLTNKSNRVLYTGVTNNLQRRLYEHKNKLADGFTKKYNVCKLVYYELTDDVNSAIAREKQIKGLTRAKKNALIESKNSQWSDLEKIIMEI